MIEKIILDYLTSELSVPVYTEIPANPPKKFVVLNLVEGGMTNQIKAATLNFESYDESLYKAALLNESVKSALFNSVSLNSIASASMGGESRNIDTSTKSYRYETVFNFYYY